MRSLAALAAWMLLAAGALTIDTVGALQGPVGDALPYAAAAGALGLIIKGLQFLNSYQDRIVNSLDDQLGQARTDIDKLKADHRREIDECTLEYRTDIKEVRAAGQAAADAARAAIEARDRHIAALYGELRDVRRQAGLPDRRTPRLIDIPEPEEDG